MSNVIQEIEHGEHDDLLDNIIDTCSARRKVLSHRDFDLFQEGDRVRIRLDARIKPRYILGAKGTIVSKGVSRVTVEFDPDIDDPYGKWAGRRAVLDPGTIELVEEQED